MKDLKEMVRENEKERERAQSNDGCVRYEKCVRVRVRVRGCE